MPDSKSSPTTARRKGVERPKTAAFRASPSELMAIRIAAARKGLTTAAWLRAQVIETALREAA